MCSVWSQFSQGCYGNPTMIKSSSFSLCSATGIDLLNCICTWTKLSEFLKSWPWTSLTILQFHLWYLPLVMQGPVKTAKKDCNWTGPTTSCNWMEFKTATVQLHFHSRESKTSIKLVATSPNYNWSLQKIYPLVDTIFSHLPQSFHNFRNLSWLVTVNSLLTHVEMTSNPEMAIS